MEQECSGTERGVSEPESSQLAVAEDFQVPARKTLGDQLLKSFLAVVFADDEADPVERGGLPQDRELASFAIEFENVDLIEPLLLHQGFERQRAEGTEIGPFVADEWRWAWGSVSSGAVVP